MQVPTTYRDSGFISNTIFFALLLVGLYVISLYNYLLFHTLAELFSITIAGSIFLVAWNSRGRLDNGYFLFLGMVYLSVGFLDLLHTLAYKGMGVFPGRDANLPTQLWVATRYLESIALLVAPVFLSRRGRVLPGLAVCGLALALMLSIFWWGIFPDCYLEGMGLTTFKILSEYLICLILCGAGLFLYKRRAFFEAHVFHFLLWAIFFTILSELSFTFYVSVYGLSNLTGHFFKLASFYLVYRALVITGFIRPQELLFHDFERSRKALQRSEALLKTTSRMAKVGGWEVDTQTDEIAWTEGTYQIYEMPVDQRPRLEKAIECFHQEDRPKLLKAFEDAKERGLPYDLELQFITTKGKDLWTRSICQPVVENGRVVKLVGAFQDITERKQTRDILEKSERRYRQLFEAMISGFALHEIILDENGEACDYRFLEVNPSFEQLTGIKAQDLLGHTVMEVFPDTEAHWIDTYGQVAQTGQAVRFENYAQAMDKHFEVLAYSPMPGQFATIVQDITERKRAEKELQGSKEQYRELAENLNDVIYTVDLDGTITYVSPPIQSILDYTPAELIGSNVAHLIHPDDQTAIRQAFENVSQGSLTPSEYRLKKKSGDYRWVRTSSRPVFEGGQPCGLQGVLTDITERKRAEQALIESESRVRNKLEAILSPEGNIGNLELADIIDAPVFQNIVDDFFSLTNVGMAILDMQGKILVSTGWQDICAKFHRVHPETCRNCLESDLELSTEVEPGKFKTYKCKNNMWDMVTPLTVGGEHVGNLYIGQFIFEDEIPDYEIFRSQAKQYGFDEDEYLAALDRVPRWSPETVNTVMDFYTRFANVVSTLGYSNLKLAKVIEDRKQAEESLSNSEARYRTIAENFPHGALYLFDRHGRYIYANGSDLKGLDIKPQDLRGKMVTDVFPPELASVAQPMHERVLAGETVTYETKFKGRIYDNVAVPIRDSQGEVVQGLVIARNVTKDRELESQLRQAQKMEAVGTLAGGIAHDFNNILAVIMGYTEIALADAQTGKVSIGELREIFEAANRAKGLVQRILTFSRRAEYESKPLDLNEAVLAASNLLKQTLPKMIDINLELSEEIAAVMGDRYQIEQIIMNLGTNSRDAMPDGGALNISTALQTVDNMTCRACGQPFAGEYVVITVTDNGEGMGEEGLAHMFEPFFTTKEVGKGTGLGLATVFGIVKAHDGHIDCESEKGKGATFKIYLPPTKQAVGRPQDEAFEAVEGGNETILLVDDEDGVLDVGTRQLEGSGYHLITASDGEEALETFRAHREEIDLVILDLSMPGMGGHRCLQDLLSLAPDLKVIVSTGYSRDGDLSETMSSGAAALLSKPFSKNEMLKTVRMVLA